MAKFETRLRGNFDDCVAWLRRGIVEGSESATYQDGSSYEFAGTRCAVQVFERYSWTSNGRVSLTLTVFGHGDELIVTAIAAGGSQAIYFKLNTIGEEEFLRQAIKVIERYQYRNTML